MTDIAELVVRIKADASALEREMKKASTVSTREIGVMDKAAASLKQQLLGLVPAITIAGLVSFAKNATLAADRLNDLSSRTGVAATTLSAFNVPLKQSGSSVEEFASSITRMNNAIGEAANNETAAKNFTDIGLSIQELLAMSPEEQFTAIAKSLNDIDNQAEFTNRGMAIFGRQFASIAPLIRETNGEMDKFIQRQQELGLAFTAADLKMVDDFWDAMEGRIAQAEVAIVRFMGWWNQLRQTQMEMVGLSTPSDNPRISTTRPDTVPMEQVRDNLVKAASIRDKYRSSSSTSTSSSVEKVTQAQADHNAHLKDYEDSITEADRATEHLTNSIKEKLSSSLTDAAFDAENAGDAVRRMGESIFKALYEKTVMQPLTNGVVDAVGGSSIGKSITDFFKGIKSYDVGSYNVPSDQFAKIHQGEMIIPAKQAQQIRNGGSGGMTVVQHNTFQSGVTRSELQVLLPQVAAAAKDAVFDEIQRGGSASKIVGAR